MLQAVKAFIEFIENSCLIGKTSMVESTAANAQEVSASAEKQSAAMQTVAASAEETS